MKLYIEYTYFVAYHFTTDTGLGHGHCTFDIDYRMTVDILNILRRKIVKKNNYKGAAITNWKLLKIRLRFKR
jgi:hypothetical protein